MLLIVGERDNFFGKPSLDPSSTNYDVVVALLHESRCVKTMFQLTSQDRSVGKEIRFPPYYLPRLFLNTEKSTVSSCTRVGHSTCSDATIL